MELISVGTGVLTGDTVNGNIQFLAEKCVTLGFDLFFQVTVGDNYDRMMFMTRQGLSRFGILTLTGGLGPTGDDLIKKVCADVLGVPLEEGTHTREYLTRFFGNNIYRYIPKNNWEMVMAPREAVVLDNANDMVPGLILEKDDKIAILLPGSPNELCPVFSGQAFPYLQQKQNAVLISSMVRACGYGENQVEDILLDPIDAQTNSIIATYAKTAGAHLRTTTRARSRKGGPALITSVEKEVKDRFKEAIFTMGEQVNPEMAVADLLKQNNLTMCTAESCTGGMIAVKMVNVPGVSDVFMEGMVTYSNEAKMRLLGVRENTLRAQGAASEETAREMVEGGVKASGTDLCVATTDIAGLDGGADEKSASPVHMICYLRGKTCVRRYQFRGNCEKVREQVMMRSLDLARLYILGKG